MLVLTTGRSKPSDGNMAYHAQSMDRRYSSLRSVIETPIMDDRKWAKVPHVPADGFLVDIEDSVPPDLKPAARQRVAQYLQRPEYFDGRLMIARPNHLSTEWGRDDVAALADAGATCIAYPKCDSADDVLEVQALFRSRGADPDIIAAIETARGFQNMAAIAAIDKVVSVGIGVGDLSADMGVPLFGHDGELNPVFEIAKAHVAIVGAANGCFRGDMAHVPNVRDLDDVRRRYERSRGLGFTMGYAFYPPHVPVINEVFGSTLDELSDAELVIELYEQAIADGRPAVTLESGRTLLVHDYHKALRVRSRAADGEGATT